MPSDKQGHWSSVGQWMNFGGGVAAAAAAAAVVVVAAAAAVAAVVVMTFQQRLEGSMPLQLMATADV
jgi:glycerol-3-phosphate acyltransferase PlsY